MRSPRTTTKSRPRWPQLKKAVHSNLEDPRQPKKKKVSWNFLYLYHSPKLNVYKMNIFYGLGLLIVEQGASLPAEKGTHFFPKLVKYQLSPWFLAE